jgi:serine/threonine protein phosphatase PrpC
MISANPPAHGKDLSAHQGIKSRGANRLAVEFGGSSLAGAKSDNQDALAAYYPDSASARLKGAVACIADGVSSSEQAKMASQLSVTHFIQDYFSTPDSWAVKTAAARVLSALNNWLVHHGRQSPGQAGMLTTFSAVICKSATAHLLHIGDSRIYRLREQELEQLTQDHNLHQGGGRSFLGRALGMDNHLEIDYRQEALQPGDCFLLCTDGVYGCLPDTQLRTLLRESQVQPEALARKIARQALAAGSQDNISCLIVRITQLPDKDMNETYRQLTSKVIPPALKPGMTLDGFKVSQVLYNGPRSHLYLVEHDECEKPLVLKAPDIRYADDAVYLEAFSREQWAGRRIDHPAVMKIYPSPDSPFLYHLCEFVHGQTLRQWMRDNPQPSLEQASKLAVNLISALRAFQRQGMVHGDLKPENIMVQADGELKIIDFGAVQVSGLEEMAADITSLQPPGALDYCAPEYLQGEKGSTRSDMFSLGVILYEVLCGELPFKRPVLAHQHSDSRCNWQYQPLRLRRPSIPLWADLALKKAVAKHPRNRYLAFSELLQDLTVPNRQLLRHQRRMPLLERHPVQFWQFVSLLLGLLLLLQWALR